MILPLLASTQDIVVVIGALSAAIVSIIGAIFAGLAATRTHDVQQQIQMSNGKTLGTTAEANAVHIEDTATALQKISEKQ